MNEGLNMRIQILFLMLIFLISCSSKNENELFEEIKVHNEKGEYDLLIEKVNVMREDFKSSEKTLEAMELLGNLYVNNFIEPRNETENTKKAIDLFIEMNKNFPDNKKGKHYLFMAAFLSSEKLKDLEQARKLYTEFINKYPDDELTSSAKYELDNLGKSPDEILKNIETKKK